MCKQFKVSKRKQISMYVGMAALRALVEWSILAVRSHRHNAQVVCGAARQTGYTSETAPQTSEHVMSPMTIEFHVSNITNYSTVFIVTATIAIHQNQHDETALETQRILYHHTIGIHNYCKVSSLLH